MAFSSDLLRDLETTTPLLEKVLVQEVKKVFTSLLGMDHLLHLPLSDPASNFTDCMSALVGLAGTRNGLVSLHVPNSLAVKMAAQLLDTATPSEEEVEDALGEIANILAGSFKGRLCTKGMDIRLSTPSVVAGKQYVIHVAKKPEVMPLLFDWDDDWFMAALALDAR